MPNDTTPQVKPSPVFAAILKRLYELRPSPPVAEIGNAQLAKELTEAIQRLPSLY